jgi:hypothetical protein
MRLDDGELGIGQLARLVEHLHGHRRLAQVVQQPGDSRGTRLLLVERKLPGQGNHQRADGHRMHEGVVVGGLQAGQADQGAWIAHH